MAPPQKLQPQLFLYDMASERLEELLIAKARYLISNAARVKAVKDLENLGKKINAEDRIAHLVLSFHGYDGGILVGGHAHDLGEEAVRKTLSEAGRKPPPAVNLKGKAPPPPKPKPLPKVDRIDFFGCNIARKPSQLASFGQLYGAASVSAYTWSIVHQAITVTLAKNNDAETIRSALAKYEGFIYPPPNFEELERRAKAGEKRVRLLVVYGSDDGSAATFPITSRKGFRPLGDAHGTVIDADRAAAADQTYDVPVVGFEYVTVRATPAKP